MATKDATLGLPRILCLHGGGVNAAIFKAQMRAFLTHPELQPRFRFVFVDAPFFCDEGVGVHPVYSDWGPFRRWSRWVESHPEIDAETCQNEMMYAIENGMKADEGIGEWVGVMGFSQGAKVACSLLYLQQLEVEATGKSRFDFRFGFILAGRAPLLALNEEMEQMSWMQSAAGLPGDARVDMDAILDRPEMKLRLPTVHVHGLKDEGLELHRRCINDYCSATATTLVEWDGPHRVPFKRADVEACTKALIDVAEEYGV